MLPLRIAWRYLLAKKTHAAVNIISLISMVGVAVATAAIDTGNTFTCGSITERCPKARSLKPLNTESTITMAAVATATPTIDISDMILTAACVFLSYSKAWAMDTPGFQI